MRIIEICGATVLILIVFGLIILFLIVKIIKEKKTIKEQKIKLATILISIIVISSTLFLGIKMVRYDLATWDAGHLNYEIKITTNTSKNYIIYLPILDIKSNIRDRLYNKLSEISSIDIIDTKFEKMLKISSANNVHINITLEPEFWNENTWGGYLDYVHLTAENTSTSEDYHGASFPQQYDTKYNIYLETDNPKDIRFSLYFYTENNSKLTKSTKINISETNLTQGWQEVEGHVYYDHYPS